MDICDSCKKKIPFGAICLSGEDNDKTLCSNCFNEIIAKRWGIDKPAADFEPVTMKDADRISHTFHIQTMLTTGLGMEAIEVENNEIKTYGYKFNILVHPETEPIEAFKILYEKMKDGLSRKYIIADKKDSDLQINNDDIIIGRIEDEYDGDDSYELCFSIDGEKYTYDELKRMLSSYPGFNFKLTIYDPSENIPYEKKQDINDELY